MKARNKNQPLKLLLATSLQDDDYLWVAVERLQKRLGASVHIVNIVEISPWLSIHNDRFQDVDQLIKAVTDTAQDEILRRKGDLGENVTFETCLGDEVDEIIRVAVEKDMDAIVCGYHVQSGFIPAGFSTALSLMGHSPIPTLVIPKDCERCFAHESFKMLVADDLVADSSIEIDGAVDWATMLGNCQVNHLHIDDYTADFKSKMMAQVVEKEPQFKAQLKALRGELLKKMEDRGPYHTPALEASGGKYTYQLAEGEVFEELEKVNGEFDPDIVVFGRHKTVHRKPFHFGSVNFRYMMALKKPVLLFPRVEPQT